MKTQFNKILRLFAAVVFVALMASCGSNAPSADEVANRINTDQSLTEADYSGMIDYCGKYAQEAQKYYDEINAAGNDSTVVAKATMELAELYGKYTYLDLFRNKLASTDMTQLGAENEKKVNEYAKYQGFPLPQGEGADLQDPNVVGMIEDMPADSGAVIADGAGEAVK